MSKQTQRMIDSIRSNYGLSLNDSHAKSESDNKPHTAEPAMIHPLNNSTIKVRDKGIIDLFTNTDNGLRIDPHSQTINVIANSSKQHVGNIKENVSHSSYSNIGGNWTINVGGNARVHARNAVHLTGRDVYINAEQSLHLDATEVHLKANTVTNTISDTYTLDVAGDINMNSEARFNLKANILDQRANGAYTLIETYAYYQASELAMILESDLRITSSDPIAITGDMHISKGIEVTEDVLVKRDLIIEGDTDLQGNLEIGGDLDITGALQAQEASLTGLTVTGPTYLQATTISGQFYTHSMIANLNNFVD